MQESHTTLSPKRAVLGAISGVVLVMCVVLLFSSSRSGNISVGSVATGLSWSEAAKTALWDSTAVFTLEQAAEDATERVAAMATPDENPRLYTPGAQGENEAFCRSNFDNKFCNHLHGEWGDNIPQTGAWCAWAVLEFQDPPSDVFNYNGASSDFTAFNTKFNDVLTSATSYAMAEADNETGILAVASGYGIRGSDGNTDSPWPVSSVIWNMGNKYAKPWITDSHRPSAQCQGLRWGFTFYGHWKAVKCADVNDAMTQAGINILPGSDEAREALGGECTASNNFCRLYSEDFRKFWNAYTLIEDRTEELACKSGGRRLLGGNTWWGNGGNDATCSAANYPGNQCTQGPCTPDTDDPCPSRDDTAYTAAT